MAQEIPDPPPYLIQIHPEMLVPLIAFLLAIAVAVMCFKLNKMKSKILKLKQDRNELLKKLKNLELDLKIKDRIFEGTTQHTTAHQTNKHTQ